MLLAQKLLAVPVPQVSIQQTKPAETTKPPVRINIVETSDVATQITEDDFEQELKPKQMKKHIVMYQPESFSKLNPEIMVTIP